MKYTLLVLFLLLCGLSAVSALTRQRDPASKVATLYWMSDVNPTRNDQVRQFNDWLAAHGGPRMRLKLDESMAGMSGSTTAVSNPDAKIVIQGVSGVLGDIFDIGTVDMTYLQDIGLLDDLTPDAKRMGFGLDATYPSIAPLISRDGRQYLFPPNVVMNLLVLNKAVFRKFDLPLPRRRWTLEQFESAGRAFVAAANPADSSGQPIPPSKRVFFADRVEAEELRRGMGLSAFNETLTASTLDDPRGVRSLQLMQHWSNDLHLLPTQADAASFAAGGGYGGAAPQLLRSGQCAMILYSLNLLIPLRQYDQPVDLAASEMPNGGFPCTLMRARGTGIYRASPHRDLARYFLSYLASAEYNENSIDNCDALPPNPKYLKGDRFLRPAGHENEWEWRQTLSEAATTIGIPVVVSPFVDYHTSIHVELLWQEAFLSGICSAEAASTSAKRQVDAAIRQQLDDEPSLRGRYQTLLFRQRLIDDLKKAGKPVPLDWIENPFYQSYYARTQSSGSTAIAVPANMVAVNSGAAR